MRYSSLLFILHLAGMIAPIPGLPQFSGRGPFPFSIVDEVLVPASLAPGPYILSWRWDAEQTKQVWSQCASVEIAAATTDDASPSVAISTTAAIAAAAAAAVAAAAPLRSNVCIGESIGLDVDECAAWIDLYDSLNGVGWVGHNNVSAAAARTNPCAALSSWWKKSIVCVRVKNE
jgi:hypothetical protein